MSNLPDDYVVYETKITVGDLRELSDIFGADFDIASLDNNLLALIEEVLEAHKRDVMSDIVFSTLDDFNR